MKLHCLIKLLNLKMSVNRRNWLKHGSNLRLVLLVLWLVCYVGYGQFEDFKNPAVLQMVQSNLYKSTAALNKELATKAKFCVKDLDADWNKAFNFSDLKFLSSCIQKTNASDAVNRICTEAEMKLYINGLLSKADKPGDKQVNMKPNRNCNLTSWVSGCEPGWACSLDHPTEQADLQNSKNFQERTSDCMPCCEGFFCPKGLTCMIPCPLGSYCPLATLNMTSGLCDPYTYQPPPGKPEHTCGGANVWADHSRSDEVFCPAGYYCPTTTSKLRCDSGHYCRMGSTSKNPCFKLTSCKANSANLHAFGIMVICGVVIILIIIYNCSDQILTTREKRQAKSREAAVKKAKANQRWKVARSAAKKHVTEISQTLSGKKNKNDGETHRMLDRGYSSEVDSSSSPASSSSAVQQPSFEIEDDAAAGSNKGPSGKRGKGQRIKNSQSQILKYAYNQIEKEKAMELESSDLTFSGIVNMATYSEMKMRTLLELSFQDLTLTLKSNGKNLLRCVTGTMKPGRITAVMGPSGAGKTSLLNALAGKAVGCNLSGLLLINGKQLSIHSYKKIIGFVPQDDIVHGNLTVEENIWFHARCRLPAGQSKAEKVLVVERVIDSLGLQGVRSSLVGTVEKRGISGGQRKRVNVGLEMAMEPSVLFLDEPTSGLDSASSQLLLKALKHEALEGVNICMVVHQPSYTLFKTFNDLVLLAKGGLTVYHGPVENVEEYFSGLGIIVPERINPPDYYIDVLEGIVTNLNSDVSIKELPQRWMLHKGYSVPLDMRKENNNSAEPTFVRELLGDVTSNFRLRGDKIRHNFSKTKDLSYRRTPSMWLQYKYFLGRIAKQRMREAKLQATDYLILLLAGACLGLLKKGSDENFGKIAKISSSASSLKHPEETMASSSFAILPLLNYNSTTNRSSSSYSSPIRFWNLPKSKHRSAKHSNPRSPQVLVSFSLNQPADEESSDAALFLESNSIADYMRFKRRSDADDGNNNNGSSELQTAIVSYKKRFPWILLNPFLQVDLVSTIHIADKEYFTALQKELEAYDSILYEMVTSKESLENRRNPIAAKRLKTSRRSRGFSILGFIQRQMARVLTLDFQLDCLDYEAKNWYHADLDFETFTLLQKEKGESFYSFARDMTIRSTKAMIQPALVTEGLDTWRSKLLWVSRVFPMPLVGLFLIGAFCADFENQTEDYPELEALSRLDFGAAMKVFLAKRLTSELTQGTSDIEEKSVIIGERNRAATEALKRAIEQGHKRVAILYGGGHMPDLGRRLREEFDLVPSEVRWVTAWSISNPRDMETASFPFLRTMADALRWPLNRYQTLALLIFSSVLALDLCFWELFLDSTIDWGSQIAGELYKFVDNTKLM